MMSGVRRSAARRAALSGLSVWMVVVFSALGVREATAFEVSLESPAEDVFSYVGGVVTTDTSNPIGVADENALRVPALPFAGDYVFAVDGVRSQTAYDLARDRFGFAFDLGDLTMGLADASASVVFSVSQDVRYELAGVLAGVDVGAAYFEATLREPATGELLFSSVQAGMRTRDPVYRLGEMRGDLANGLVGSLTGVLRASRIYEFHYAASVQTANSGGRVTMSSATGTAELLLVPEATSALLTGAGLIWLCIWRRRERQPGARRA